MKKRFLSGILLLGLLSSCGSIDNTNFAIFKDDTYQYELKSCLLKILRFCRLFLNIG